MKYWMAGTIYLIAIQLICFSLGSTMVAGADIAPPEQPTGANLVPGQETTRVRMLSEQVLIEVQPDTLPADNNSRISINDWAKVTASFQMQNTGPEAEKMDVRFPLMNPSGMGDGFGNLPELKDFHVEVDGVSINYKTVPIINPESFEKTGKMGFIPRFFQRK